MESIRGEEKAPSIVKNPTAVTVEWSEYTCKAWFLYLVGESFDAPFCNKVKTVYWQFFINNDNSSENYSGILFEEKAN